MNEHFVVLVVVWRGRLKKEGSTIFVTKAIGAQ
jgi:hypothetical protein